MKKNIICSLIILFIIFVFNTTVFSRDNVTLRIAWWGSQDRHDRTLEVINLFEKKYPDIKIIPEYTTWVMYWDRMAEQAAVGMIPDIMQHDYKFLLTYHKNNLLLNLEPFIGDELRLKDVNNELIKTGKIDGKLYAIPLAYNTFTIIYDPVLFKKAGIKDVKSDWTWEDYLKISRKLHDELGIYAATYLPMMKGNIIGFEYYVRQHGQTLFDDSGKKLGFDDKLFIDFYNMDLKLEEEGVLAPPEVRLEHYTFENDLLINRQAAMSSNWSNIFLTLKELAGRPLKMLLLPTVRDQVRSGQYLKPSMFFTITKNCKHPEEAALFIDFFINHLEANNILKLERGIPISSKIRKQMKPFLNETEQQVVDFIEYADDYCSPIDPPFPPQYKQIFDLLEKLSYDMLYKKITPEQAVVTFKEESKRILSDN